jgi:hypothetical protein
MSETGDQGVRKQQRVCLSKVRSRNGRSATAVKEDGTYVEDLKDPDEIQPPGRNLLLVVPCVDDSRN